MMQTIQQLIDSISLPEGTLPVIGLTDDTDKMFLLDTENRTLNLLTIETVALDKKEFNLVVEHLGITTTSKPVLTEVNPSKINLAKIVKVGYKTKWSSIKGKIVPSRLVNGKLTF